MWGVWAAWLLAGLLFVAKFSTCNVPRWADELIHVPVLTGEQSVTARWLWEGHLESRNRLLLYKPIYLALFKCSGQDFRAAAFFNVAALGLVAFALLWAARRLRGRTDYTDAFFPLLLLNWGQTHTLMVGIQGVYILVTILACAALLVVVWGRAPLSPGATLLMGICLVLLPLCCASGLPYVPPLTCWLAYTGAISWRSSVPGGRRNGLLAWGLAAAALLVVFLSVFGFEPGDREGLPRPPMWDTLKVTIQFLSMGLTMGPGRLWPVLALIMAGLLLASAGILTWAVWREPLPERSRALGLLAFLGAVACLAVAVGLGRAEAGGLESRYMTLMAPALCCTYFVWEIYAAPALRHPVKTGLLVVMVVLIPLDVRAGLATAQGFRDREEALQRDLRAGVPGSFLANRHSRVEWEEELWAKAMPALHSASVGPFRRLQGDPTFREVPLDLKPAELNQVTLEAGIARVRGKDSYLVFSLSEPRFVYGIRIRCAYVSREQSGGLLWVDWRRSSQDDFPEEQREEHSMWDEERTVRVWVNGTIDRFRIHPYSGPCTVRIEEIALLVPEAVLQPAPGP